MIIETTVYLIVCRSKKKIVVAAVAVVVNSDQLYKYVYMEKKVFLIV